MGIPMGSIHMEIPLILGDDEYIKLEHTALGKKTKTFRTRMLGELYLKIQKRVPFCQKADGQYSCAKVENNDSGRPTFGSLQISGKKCAFIQSSQDEPKEGPKRRRLTERLKGEPGHITMYVGKL